MPRTKKSTTVEQMEVRSGRKRKTDRGTAATTNSGQDYISTGSTLLNLALSDKWNGGWPCGKIVNLIGDSSSGKTFIALTAFAEMSKDKKFNNYLRIFDDAEAANEFDMEKLFGKRTAKLVKSPGRNGENSNTIQDLEVHVTNALDEGVPFLYIQDSFDSLTSQEEEKRTEDRVEAWNAGKSGEKGTYGMEKAKKVGSILRQIKTKLRDSGSTLIIISQTRDNIGIGFAAKTRSGGKALKFYSTHELWTAMVETLKRKKVPIGVKCRIKISKNKLTGKVREVSIPIYYDYGVDDIESCIDYLVENGYWPVKGRTIDGTKDFDRLKGSKERLIRIIEEEDLEEELSQVVGEYWARFEESLIVVRKNKYD